MLHREHINSDALYFFQIKKPLIEKQRRKRINDSLHELKRLVLEALNRDVSLTMIYIIYFNFPNKIFYVNMYSLNILLRR